MLLACVFLILFASVATTDSMYFHVWKYRLHNRPDSYFEHLTHTTNICLFVPATWLMFCVEPQGMWLYVVLFLLTSTLAVELCDVFSEKHSRATLGGLTSTEYAMHFLMSGLRMGCAVAWFAIRPLSDFTAQSALGEALPWVRLIGWCMVIPGTLIAALHVALIFTGRAQGAPA